MRRSLVVFLARLSLAVVLIMVDVTGSLAEDSADARYQRLVREGIAEFEAGHFAEARSLFVTAHALQPNARTLRGLGMVEYELRNYADSAVYLEQALASDVKPLDEALRREASEVLARARSYLARVRLRVSPDNATLQVNGVATAYSIETPLVLTVGDHVLSFQAPGRRPQSHTVHLIGGQETTLDVVLEPDVDLANQQEKRPLRKNAWLWTGIGVVVSGAAVGLAIGLGGRDTERQASPYGGDTGAILGGP